MRAAILTAFNAPIPVETVADPICPPDGVIVSVRACGVCRSDHHTWTGADADVPLPHIMGHEFAGVVAEVGPECTSFKAGDRVTAPFILGCGHCTDCKTGQPTICEDQRLIGFTAWGAFAEYVAVTAADFNLVRLPASIDFGHAAGMGCRVTTAWRGLHERAALKAGEWLAVHGCGGVGLSAIMLARAMSARIIAVDVSPSALALARDMGADHCINAATEPDVAAAIQGLTGGGAHVAVDALGISETFDNALRSLRKLGRHVQIGMPVGSHATVPLPLLDLVYARQLSIHGMRGLGASGFGALLDMVERGSLDLAPLITKRIPLTGVEEALRQMDHGQPAGITIIDRF